VQEGKAVARKLSLVDSIVSLRRITQGMMAFGIALLVAQPAGAALLGLPFALPVIGVGFGDSSGATSYDATTGLFSVVADPTAILLTPGSAPAAITPSLSGEHFELSMRVDHFGGLVSGIPSADMVLVGQTALAGLGSFEGVLLTAEVSAFGYLDAPGSTDYFDFRVRVTGGQLAFLFDGSDGYVLLSSQDSGFAGSFASSFGGGARGNIKATPTVPEPSAALLFAACSALVWTRQRR
jgi:hypothetical protein